MAGSLVFHGISDFWNTKPGQAKTNSENVKTEQEAFAPQNIYVHPMSQLSGRAFPAHFHNPNYSLLKCKHIE